jgi:prepilin-type processing-associated H-X9-DG protein
MSRTAPKLNTVQSGSGNSATITINYPAGYAIKGLGGTLGPLTQEIVDNSPQSSSVVPLAFDANVGDAKEAFLKTTIPGFLPAGSRLCETMSDGPCRRAVTQGKLDAWGSSSTGDITVLDTDAGVNLFAEENPPKGTTAAVYNHLQDYRDIGPVHGGTANILFADGSVKTFKDQNGDGYLNPGFQLPTTLTEDEKAAIGYTDSLVELPPAEVFSGVFLIKSSNKGNLDQQN